MERHQTALRDESGLGLMEIVTAMFVIAVLSLSLLPLLITGMQAAVSNTTIAAATQFANDRLSVARAVGAQSSNPCDSIAALGDAPASMIDARGVELRATTTVGACPAGVGTIVVATAVARVDTNEVLARASTSILVVP